MDEQKQNTVNVTTHRFELPAEFPPFSCSCGNPATVTEITEIYGVPRKIWVWCAACAPFVILKGGLS